jgi:hypothetical protein
VSARWWGQFSTIVAIIFLVLFIFRGTVDFRTAIERPGEWHIGVWYNRGFLSIRLVKVALIWSWV